MSGPAIGEPDPGRAEPARTGFGDAAGGILVLLALGLILRLIIAYLLPGSGFAGDLASFRFWADNLADHGIYGFYDRAAAPGGFFADYTPGYMYVLWVVGTVANILGNGVGDLIKIPPILGDLALAYLVWSMTLELGGSKRAARLGAIIVILNPVTWFDSVVWGQVDSVGVVFLLLALRELWRDRPERSAILATVAAIIKPQLAIMVPLVAIVVIRRAFWPKGGFGAEDEPAPRGTTTAWETRIRGPIRVLTTGAAGFLTAVAMSLPFGLSIPGLIGQVFKTAAGYPYLSVNAFNPWALVVQTTPERDESIALHKTWICDSTIHPAPAGNLTIGDWQIWSWPASTQTCDPGVYIGAFPAVVVGAALFLAAAALILWLVGRRPDRITMLIGLVLLAIAFFVLPTRVHERYLFPFVAVAAILAAVSLRWRIAYLLSGAAMFANMYVIIVNYYHENPGITDWLGQGETLAGPWPVAIGAMTQVGVFVWAFFQLREEATEDLADRFALAGRDPVEGARLAGWLGREVPEPDPDDEPEVRPLVPWGERAVPRLAAALSGGRVGAGGAGAGHEVVLPAWDMDRDAGTLGPIGWFRARLRDAPVRADRSRLLNNEGGGKLDRLDAWVLVLLAISLFTVRMWRLDEPYQVHFDEVYHPRTATEFLQDWRYGLSHNIYEWTHPHMAKYAMAAGLVALGEDRVSATSSLGIAVVDAVIEPRRDQRLDSTEVQGDRLWVATGSEVRAYDLATRSLAGTLTLPDAVALAYDRSGHALYVGTRSGEIRIVDVGGLDASRRGPPAQIESRAYMSVDGPIDHMFVSRTGDRLVAVLTPGFGTEHPETSQVVVIDATAAIELGRPQLRGVGQITIGVSDDRIAVATSDGLTFIEPVAATIETTLDLGGPVMGVVGINDIENDPIFATSQTADGPRVSIIIAKTGADPRFDTGASGTAQGVLVLPDATAGRVYYDLATRMVHIEGTRREPGGQPQPTIYVLEPHGNAVYADAPLAFVPVVMVVDENQQYPSTDRQQLLAFDAGGSVATVEVGRHAYAWRVPGVVAGVLMALFLYVLARLLFKRRTVAVLLAVIVMADGMLFAQSRIGMNDSYVGLGIVAAYTIFAALWLRPGDSRTHWLAFALGVPLIGFFLGFALASKWVAAYAIGGLGILALVRSALGRLAVIAGLIFATATLGYVAISVAEGSSGGNFVFFLIMVALVIVAVIANTIHPIAWTIEELWFAVGAPSAAGALAVLYGLSRGDATVPFKIGPISATPIQLGLAGLLVGVSVYAVFNIVGRFGFGPLAGPPPPDDPAAILDPPAEAPRGWLRLGTGWGLPAIWLAVGIVVIPLGLYVISYIPWALVENHQLWAGATPGTGWPLGHTGDTLLDLTNQMYTYHNNLSSAHPASSPWWAWAFDLKPVWFYEEGFAGRTSASIYDAGNLVAWWLAVPAMAFVAWQAFRRHSAALALIAIAFACQWISWARIDRAAFQYHYYTALPFLFLALAYFLAELWHGSSRRTWLLARLSAAAMVLGPFGLWLLHRPLCAIVRVTDIVSDSQACPTLIPEVTITPRAVAIAVVVGVGVLLLVRELLAIADEAAGETFEAESSGWRGLLARIGLGSRWATAGVIGVVTSLAFVAVSTVLRDTDGLELTKIPVEPIALFVTLALSPVAAYVATARDSRRFVLGALGAMAFWFILWYPNISGLPLPSALHNAYQGILPTYLYPFQFWVLQGTRPAAPSLFAVGPAIVLILLALMSVVIAYSAWSWRIALAERRRDRLAGRDDSALAVGAD